MPDVAGSSAPKTPKRLRAYDPRRALGRLGLALVTATLATEVLSLRFGFAVQLLGGWDAGGLAMLGASWVAISRSDAATTRARAGADDPGRRAVYFIVMATSAATLFGATLVSRHLKSVAGAGESTLLLVLCLDAVSVAWALTHTAFTFRYAHLYYREDDEGVGGITFAGAEAPSYFDFAYFAFTIGMCFQVSDTTVTSCQIRRAVLGHAVLSFAYTTVILAFVLNTVFGAVH
jgi:uncharacterized membrane protein